MIYICAQPATIYFAWQIDTMLFSFINVGIDLKNVHIVCAIHEKIDPYFQHLEKKYLDVNFFFYKDTRKNKSYIPNIQPHILKKHFTQLPELEKETIFFHDPDIVFTKPLNTESFVLTNDCYLSDTISYIGANYIKEKGEEILDKMCEIVGIDRQTVEENQQNSGGAQYILNGIDKYYWYDVEKDSQRLYDEILPLSTKLKKEGEHALQIWTAGMWGMLWNLWKRNKKTILPPELNFTWAPNTPANWHKNAIYHNAGGDIDEEYSFNKSKYIDKIPPLDLNIKADNCATMYYYVVKQALSFPGLIK